MKETCVLCGTRKARRACPALARNICPVCCATKRHVEITCPPDCGYLSVSRSHPAAVIQRRQERDMAFLIPRIADLSETQYRILLMIQAVIVRHAKQAMPAPRDADVADGVGTVAATLETAGKGIIYEHRATAIPAQRVADAVSAVTEDLVKRVGADGARLERDAAKALRALERTVRDAQTALPDPVRPETSWLALASRIFADAPQTADADHAQAPGPQHSKLVI
jgi:hypothetical protein